MLRSISVVLFFFVFLIEPLQAIEQTETRTSKESHEVKTARVGSSHIELEELANRFYWSGDYQNALIQTQRLHDCFECEKKHPDRRCARTYANIGFCYLGLDKGKEAEEAFKKALEIAGNSKKSRRLDLADYRIGLAESDYKRGQYSRAIEGYNFALDAYEKQYGQYSPELLPALEGIAGCHYAANEYQDALAGYERVAQIDVVQYGADHKRVGMSLNNLSDVYYKLGRCDAARPLFAQSVWIFRQYNMKNMIAQYDTAEMKSKYSSEQLKVIFRRIKDVVMGTANPPEIKKISYKLLEKPGFNEDTPVCVEERARDFNNWRLSRSEAFESGFVQIDPLVEQKGLIVCLHGLGLHHNSYKNFAERICPLGYGVVAFDVRGFGALSYEKGFDKIDLNAGLEDLGAIIGIIREHNPGMPVFLLGESMGGALALQFTARYPRLVDGLIGSVPSGRRFKSKRTGFLVGLKLLEDPNRPFEIGKRVIQQATADEKTQEDWLNDPEARLKLSAQELVDFQAFMNHNQQFAKEIVDTPVILFQGFQDHLVRPTGTYALYQALGTNEKDLIFIGSAEHLIFEEGQASDATIKMLGAWLDAHISRANSGKTTEISGEKN